jgi:histidinol phosphatase-like PHP family hydrolase
VPGDRSAGGWPLVGVVTGRLLDPGQFDRVLGFLHCLPVGERFFEPPELYKRRPAAEVIREYLAEIPRLITSSDAFTVLAHIDYPVRTWPAQAGRFDPHASEDEFRHALRVLADGDRALEVNTQVPLHPDRTLGGAKKAEKRSRSEVTPPRPDRACARRHRGRRHG